MPLTWFFDLDNTLHDASHAIFGMLDHRINTFVMQRLNVPQHEANQIRMEYWRRYGATLLGLAKHHGVTGPEYFVGTHSFDPRPMMRFEAGLAKKLLPMRGKKVLITNAPAIYSHQVMAHLGLARGFHAHVAIDHMTINGIYHPKPSTRLLKRLLAKYKLRAASTVLVEDSAENLKAAKRVGMKTVLVNGYTRDAARKQHAKLGGNIPFGVRVGRGKPPYVDCLVHSVRALRRKKISQSKSTENGHE
jgi:putative hydrolase of the HAD superfamily